jgi:hypothetical protein
MHACSRSVVDAVPRPRPQPECAPGRQPCGGSHLSLATMWWPVEAAKLFILVVIPDLWLRGYLPLGFNHHLRSESIFNLWVWTQNQAINYLIRYKQGYLVLAEAWSLTSWARNLWWSAPSQGTPFDVQCPSRHVAALQRARM